MNKKIIIGLLTALLILHIAITNQVYSQSRASIAGTVIDDSTSLPLRNVNVFLSNTTLGSATDETGKYRMTDIPCGSYRVAVSMMGYRFESESIEILEDREYQINFELKPEAIQGPSIEIVDEFPRERRRKLRRFERLFLGWTHNARKCELINQYVLEFKVDEAGYHFVAETREPLIVENHALGYRLHVHLEEFDWREDNQGRYVAAVRFEELEPESEDQREKWFKEREHAYLGSRRHFLRSLIEGNFWKHGFDVFRTYRMNAAMESETARRVARASQYLISDTPVDFLKALSFSGYLKVVYRPYNQTSFIYLNLPEVLVDARGQLFQPRGVTVFGYWSKMRVAEELPSNYNPKVE
jgi:hypothetical protein